MRCPMCRAENIEGAEVCEGCGGDLTFLSRPKAHSEIEWALHKVRLSNLRRHPALCVTPATTVREVVELMTTRKEGCAVVTDEAGTLLGVFSDRDLLMKVAGGDEDQFARPVSEFMTADPVTIAADAPIAYALHQMDLGGYRHLPLMEGDRAVGMVSIRDIVSFIDQCFGDENP